MGNQQPQQAQPQQLTYAAYPVQTPLSGVGMHNPNMVMQNPIMYTTTQNAAAQAAAAEAAAQAARAQAARTAAAQAEIKAAAQNAAQNAANAARDVVGAARQKIAAAMDDPPARNYPVRERVRVGRRYDLNDGESQRDLMRAEGYLRGKHSGDRKRRRRHY